MAIFTIVSMAHTTLASWAFVSLEQRLETCSVVVAGKIEKVKVNDRPDRNATRWSDTAFLKVTAVLKNDLNLPAVKEGATLQLEMPSIKNKVRMSLDFRYKEGDEGVWLLHSANGRFTVGYPGDLLPLQEQQRVAGLVRQIRIEQAAVTPQVREAAKRHVMERDAVPLYTMERFNADANRPITPEGNPDLWQMAYMLDDKGIPCGVALDRSGAVMLTTRYYLASGFTEGLALVGTHVDRGIKDYGFIDKTGKLVIAAKYDGGEGFSEGLALVYEGRRCFYIEKSGKRVSGKYQTGSPFKDGRGQVWDAETTYLLRRNGEIAYQCRRGDAGFWSEGLLQVGMQGYVDADGKLAIDCSEKALGIWTGAKKDFRQGLAAVQGDKQLWGYISKEGKVAIQPRFVAVDQGQFSEGLAAVVVDVPDPDSIFKWGYIDPTGKVVIPPQFVTAGPFSEGLAAVTVITWVANPALDKPAVHQQKYGYIDKEGKLVIGAWFDRAEAFRNGLARVSEDAYHVGYINHDGKYVWQTRTPDFREIER